MLPSPSQSAPKVDIVVSSLFAPNSPLKLNSLSVSSVPSSSSPAAPNERKPGGDKCREHTAEWDEDNWVKLIDEKYEQEIDEINASPEDEDDWSACPTHILEDEVLPAS